MSAYERLRQRLAGEEVDRPLNLDILRFFTTSYIRQPLARCDRDHRVLVAANLAAQTGAFRPAWPSPALWPRAHQRC